MGKEKIAKARFMYYEKVRQEGKMNMMGYPDKGVLFNYDALHKHFIKDKKTEDLEVEVD